MITVKTEATGMWGCLLYIVFFSVHFKFTIIKNKKYTQNRKVQKEVRRRKEEKEAKNLLQYHESIFVLGVVFIS